MMPSDRDGHYRRVARIDFGDLMPPYLLTGVTPLSKAREGGFSDIEKLLLARGATEEGEVHNLHVFLFFSTVRLLL